jgi:AraC-like DNA-binding protein
MPHLDIALRHAPSALTMMPIPRLEISVGQPTTGKAPCLYRSMICFILQGSKQVAINDELLSYDPAHYLISALDLPLSGQIMAADGGKPYVAVSLVLDPALLADVAFTMPQVRDPDPQGIGIAINPMTAPLRDTLLRLLSLLDTPADIPVLAPMAERELLYRLLQGPQGRLLRQIAQPDGALSRIRRAVEWIRDNHNARLRIEALCDASGMSRASLHRHFLAVTGVSPLQYQKQLRLQKARQLLLAGDHNASDVAFAVGYESASQFSREYLRQFGAPPARDVRQIRQAIGSPAMQDEGGHAAVEGAKMAGSALTHS